MMPVVRISKQTYSRLQSYASPLEDTAEDVVRRALDALDQKHGKIVSEPVASAKPSKNPSPKTPQKDFRIPLMTLLDELGGKAQVSVVRDRLLPEIRDNLLDGDFCLVSTGEERWWNATCWERKELVEEGLFQADSPRGTWELSEEGRAFIRAKLSK